MTMRILMFLAASGLLGASCAVEAQTLYKSTMPDGKVIYGEKPAPGALKSEALKPVPRETGVRTLPPGVATQSPAKPAKEPVDTNQVEINLRLAEYRLREAEAALEKGKEPLEGERRPSALAGKSQLNDAYWERQRSLESAVENARQEIDRLRNQLDDR